MGLGSLVDSYALASELQTAAETVGIAGRKDLSAMSWRLAVPHSEALNRLLRAVYIDPVLEAGDFGESLLESVRAYLASNLDVRAAAASIPVHPNTLRYRLQRFEQLTGHPLDFSSLMEISWALAAIGRTVPAPS